MVVNYDISLHECWYLYVSDYICPQEEQAFILEMLGLYDEALVQYDELDVLFNQFVLNSNVGGEYNGGWKEQSRVRAAAGGNNIKTLLARRHAVPILIDRKVSKHFFL
jgi:hypothetical protein